MIYLYILNFQLMYYNIYFKIKVIETLRCFSYQHLQWIDTLIQNCNLPLKLINNRFFHTTSTIHLNQYLSKLHQFGRECWRYFNFTYQPTHWNQPVPPVPHHRCLHLTTDCGNQSICKHKWLCKEDVHSPNASCCCAGLSWGTSTTYHLQNFIGCCWPSRW